MLLQLADISIYNIVICMFLYLGKKYIYIYYNFPTSRSHGIKEFSHHPNIGLNIYNQVEESIL